MTLVVALSGGVDSVVLLDMLVKSGEYELVVAHFDHGIRPESDADARFCRALAQGYALPFEVRREDLGEMTSEATARTRRYVFLGEVAKKYGARIVTAHHQDDLVETVAINISRGTGWRGLAVFGNKSVIRPLLGMTKQDIYSYALEHNLEWVEDETNQDSVYMRNRLRKRMSRMPAESKLALIRLYEDQVVLRANIEKEIDELRSVSHSRIFLRLQDRGVARELLHGVTSGKLTRPQLDRFYEGICTLNPGSIMTLGGGLIARIKKDSFSLDILEHLHRG